MRPISSLSATLGIRETNNVSEMNSNNDKNLTIYKK